MTTTPIIRVQENDFDIAWELDAITKDQTNIGAVVSFTGLCRDEGGVLEALELEHYAGMADAQLNDIATQACNRWPLEHLLVIHRYGKIAPGENIVLVIATSSHRQAAFNGASFVMDFLKTEAPFWKKEHFKDGTSGEWVAAKDKDNEARNRWT